MKAMLRLSYIIFAVLLVYPIIGDMQPTDYTGKTIVDSASDVRLGDIERNVSGENVPGELVIKSRSMTEIYLSLGVLVFGLILVIFTGILAFKRGTGWDYEATRVFTISLIVTAGLFLITAGYSDQQIAPMFGLLGTIVGYLLCKSPPEKQNP